MTEPPVILLAFANYYENASAYLRNIPLEREGITGALRDAEKAGLCQVEILYETTIEKVVKAFRDFKGRIVAFHFGGHANDFSLILEDPYREKDVLFMEAFSTFLALQANLQFVFLNGCSTTAQSQLLTQKGVPTVIATHQKIGDKTAFQFATYFYESIGLGTAIGDAFQEAAALVRSLPSGSDYRALYIPESDAPDCLPWSMEHHPDHAEADLWNLPELADQPLFGLPKPTVQPFPAKPFPGLRPYYPEEQPIFWGRDRKIRQVYQLAVSPTATNIILIHGVRGAGKTSFLQAGILPILQAEHEAHFWNWGLELSAQNLSADSCNCILLDAPSTESAKTIYEKLKLVSAHFTNSKLIIAVSASQYTNWQALVEPINYTPVCLPPLKAEEIKKILQGGSQKSLTKYYKADCEAATADRIANTLTDDKGSAVAPLLQYVLNKLWDLATAKNPDVPPINQDSYQQLLNNKIWKQFLVSQLAKTNPKALANGLSLNLLNAFIKREEEKSNLIYSNLPTLQQEVIQELLNTHLLCTATIPDTKSKADIRIQHELLERPFLQLLESSQRPGQLIPRLLKHHLYANTLLDESDLKLIQSYPEATLSFDDQAKALIDSSTVAVAHARRAKLQRQIWSVFGVIAILLIGYAFVHPYLLLLGLLLFIARQGAKTIGP